MINRLKISGFRRLLDIDLQMRPLMVLIGANGAGKTSFVDATTVLSESASGKLADCLSYYGGFLNVLTRGRVNELSFEVEADTASNEENFKYSLVIKQKLNAYMIGQESLSTNVNIFEDTNQTEGFALESRLSEFSRRNPQEYQIRQYLSNNVRYHNLDVSRHAPIKMPQQLVPATYPGENGEYLVPFLYYLREELPERFDTIIDTLRAAFPYFKELKFPSVAAGMMTMALKDKNFETFYINELSDGMLRFIWLVSILQSTNHASLTMIDEPEISLHPELLSILADLFREASQRTQLIVATHSDRLIGFLKPEEIAVMEIGESGDTSIQWADSMDIEGWLSEYRLDEMWQMGIIGGRAL